MPLNGEVSRRVKFGEESPESGFEHGKFEMPIGDTMELSVGSWNLLSLQRIDLFLTWLFSFFFV